MNNSFYGLLIIFKDLLVFALFDCEIYYRQIIIFLSYNFTFEILCIVMPSGGWLGLRLTYEGRGKLR